jgi:ribonuclease R
LASEGYTHFTSPIRRYPDLVVHRVLRQALRAEKKLGRPLDERTRRELEDELTDVCEHCSYRERLAANAERESIKLKQVRLMQKHLGDEFDGKVNGMTENGLFVQLDDPFVEGMIHKDTMNDDTYEFNEERMVFAGKRKKRTFQMGDAVRVRVARADIDQRMIDFELLQGGKQGIDLNLPVDRMGKPHRKGKKTTQKGGRTPWGSPSAAPASGKREPKAWSDRFGDENRPRKGKHPVKGPRKGR